MTRKENAMKRTISILITAAALVALAAITTDAQKVAAGCQNLPSESQLRQLLVQAQEVNKPIRGLFQGTKMCAAVVNRDGAVCAFATSTNDPAQVWPGSQAIAKAKAYTANAFSVDDLPQPTPSFPPHRKACASYPQITQIR